MAPFTLSAAKTGLSTDTNINFVKMTQDMKKISYKHNLLLSTYRSRSSLGHIRKLYENVAFKPCDAYFIGHLRSRIQ